MMRNVLLVLAIVVLVAGVSPAFGQTITPLDLTGGFNMKAWCSPAMTQSCYANNKTVGTLFGNEVQGYATGMGMNSELVADTSVGDTYPLGTNPAGNTSYSDSPQSWFYPQYLTGAQGTPENGALTSTWDGRLYQIAAINGSAPMAGNTLDSKNATILIANPWTPIHITSRTITVSPAGYYSDINFVLAAGSGEGWGGNGAQYYQIWAVYADSTSTLLYNFGGTGAGFVGPCMLGAGVAPINATADPDFATVYATAESWNIGSGATGNITTGSLYLYEFAMPITLNATKPLQSIKLVDTQTGTLWISRELGLFAATATQVPPPSLPVTITVNQTTGGTVSVTPSPATYSTTSVVTINAAPAGGYVFSSWNVAGSVLGSSTAPTTTMSLVGNTTLSANWVNVTGSTAVPLNITAGFNTHAWCSPLMYQTCDLAHFTNSAVASAVQQTYGQESAGYALLLGGGDLLVADSAVADVYAIGIDPAGNTSYTISSDWNYPIYLSGIQGTPENGQVVSSVDSRPYAIASIQGNATVPASALDGFNAAELGQGWDNAVNNWWYGQPSVTLPVPAANYSNINLLLGAGNGSAIGATFIQIWAVYADTSSTLLYDFGSTSGVYTGPSLGGAPPVAGFSPVYTTGELYNSPTDGCGAVIVGALTLWEFATPLTLDNTKTLANITLVNNNYHCSQQWAGGVLGVFAASAVVSSSPPPSTYTVTVTQATGGTISATPTSGNIGDVVTLSNTPAMGYSFSNYVVTGGTLSGNSLTTTAAAVTVTAVFTQEPYTATVTQATGGTISATPTSGNVGDVITLSNTPAMGYSFGGYVVTGGTLSGNSLTTTGTAVTVTATFTQQTFTITATTLSNWVYQNTPITTVDRHALALTIAVTADTWGNSLYTVNVTQTGPGVVTPTQTWTSGTLVTPATSATWAGAGSALSGYIVGGRVQAGGVVLNSANKAVAGACTVHVSVIGDQSGMANPATMDVPVAVRLLGSTGGASKVTASDANTILLRVSGTATAGIDPKAYDVDGNNKIQAADSNLALEIVAGQAIN